MHMAQLNYLLIALVLVLSFIIVIREQEHWRLKNKYSRLDRTEKEVNKEWYAQAKQEAMAIYEDIIALRSKLENFRALQEPDPSLLTLIAASSIRLSGPFAPTVLLQEFVEFRSKIYGVRNAVLRINQRIAAESGHAMGLNRQDTRIKVESLCVALSSSFEAALTLLSSLAKGDGHPDNKDETLYENMQRLKSEFEAHRPAPRSRELFR